MALHPHPRVLGPQGRFTVQRLLGRGELATVFLAVDRNAKPSRLAIKLLHPEARRRGGLQRLKLEFDTLSQAKHRNLPQPFEFFDAPGETFFTLELIEGPDFVSWIRADVSDHKSPPRRPKTTEFQGCTAAGLAKLRRGLPQLVSVLSSLHDAGWVHGDIQPSNILVAYEGRVVLIDHGLSVNPAGSPADAPSMVSSDQTPIGTAAYMAPEQGDGLARRQPNSDWYGLGLILFKAMTGSLPFTGTAAEVVIRKRTLPAPRPSSLVAGVPSDLDELCVRLLATSPEERPSREELLARSEAIQSPQCG